MISFTRIWRRSGPKICLYLRVDLRPDCRNGSVRDPVRRVRVAETIHPTVRKKKPNFPHPHHQLKRKKRRRKKKKKRRKKMRKKKMNRKLNRYLYILVAT